MPKASQLTQVGLALEATFSTGLVPTKFTPVKTHDYKPRVQRIPDNGKRGVNAKDFGAYAGHRWAELSYGGDFYPDVPPYFLYGILGTKAVTGTGPYTHTFTMGATIPSFTIYDDYVANKRQMPGALVEEFTLRWGTTETTAIQWESRLRSQIGAPASAATASYGSTAPWAGWQASLTAGGSGVVRMLNGELSFKRPNELIWAANNTQDPNQFIAGELEVTGKVTLYMDDDTDLTRFETMTKPATVMTFTNGTNVLTITMTSCDWEDVNIDRSGKYVRLDANLRGLYNATDAGPVKVTVANAVANYN